MPERSAPSVDPPKKIGARAWTVQEAIDGGFFVIAGLLGFWLGWLLISKNFAFSWDVVLYLVIFWALVAYIGLPRLQQVLAKIYVPDYFIGRTVTDTGILGDPVNLAVDGTEAQIHGAMQRAGWTRADELTLRSSWGIVVSSVFRRPYPEAPVSPLFTFGRQQAFAYQQEVDGNASQRHHVRFWPTPDGWVLPGGRRVGWIAAGTYDRAVGLSLFTLQVTHKIDADIDTERDYIVATVCEADPRTSVHVLDNVFTAFRSRNGGGDVVHTDGNLPVLDVRAVEPALLPEPVAGIAAPTARRLPPPMLTIAGVLGAGKAVLILIALLLIALGVERTELLPDTSGGQLVQIGIGAAALVALWALTLMRRSWARTLLMAVCTVDAVAQLASLSAKPDGGVSIAVVLSAGLSLLILLTVSSDDARRWVGERRAPAS